MDLSFRVSGPLVSLPVDVGSKVKKGDVIAAIDPRDFQAALDSAQGNLARAQANLLAMERGARPEEIEQLKAAVAEAEASYQQASRNMSGMRSCCPKGAVSQVGLRHELARRDRTAAEVKKAKEDLNIGLKGARPEDLEAKRAEIKALEAAVANAKNQLDYAVLKAPFDGNVAARYVDNYQTVQAKQPVVRLLDVSKIEVTIQVPESLISLVPRVKKAICRFDAFAEQGVRRPGHEDRQRSLADHPHLSRHRCSGSAERRADSAGHGGHRPRLSPRRMGRRPARTLSCRPAPSLPPTPANRAYVWVVGEGEPEGHAAGGENRQADSRRHRDHRGTQAGRVGGHGRRAFAPRESGSEDSPGREPVAP